MSKKRSYLDSYVQYGFDFIVIDGLEKPQCILCSKVLGNGSMKPSILKQHLESVHPTHASDDRRKFELKRARFRVAGTLPKLGFASEKKPMVEASYHVAYRIAKAKKPHDIAEKLIKPCALDMVEILCGKETRQKIQSIPLSNNTIQRRIADMSQDICDQVVEQIKSSSAKISLQIDESCDVANYCQLIVFVRYVSGTILKNEFLFCDNLEKSAKAADIMQKIQCFFDQHNLTWEMVGSICTDGAPAMMGVKSGFTSLVKKKAPHVISTHCVLHRYALASKTLPPTLKIVMDKIIQTVNFIRARALNHRLFKAFCEEMGSEHSVLLLHTEVRWLSRGLVFSRVFELRTEVKTFLCDYGSNLCEDFADDRFIACLGYLSDIFSILNQVNNKLQGASVTIMESYEQITALQSKLDLWSRRIHQGNLANFKNLHEFLLERNEIFHLIKDNIIEHLKQLRNHFSGYFSKDLILSEKWILNPFTAELSQMSNNDLAKDELIDLQSSSTLQHEFERTGVNFWIKLSDSFPILTERAFRVIIPFVTTYLCESGFSTLVTIKTKARNRLNTSDHMRLALSSAVPRFEKLVNSMDQQCSH